MERAFRVLLGVLLIAALVLMVAPGGHQRLGWLLFSIEFTLFVVVDHGYERRMRRFAKRFVRPS